jgi:hypothetical protein
MEMISRERRMMSDQGERRNLAQVLGFAALGNQERVDFDTPPF